MKVKYKDSGKYYNLLKRAGFSFLEKESLRHRVIFRCGCGVREDVQLLEPLPCGEEWDYSRAIVESLKRVTDDHLLRDGFSNEEINFIREAIAADGKV